MGHMVTWATWITWEVWANGQTPGTADGLGISEPVRGGAWVLRMRFTLRRKGGMLQDHSPRGHALIQYCHYHYVNLECDRLYGSFGADLM